MNIRILNNFSKRWVALKYFTKGWVALYKLYLIMGQNVVGNNKLFIEIENNFLKCPILLHRFTNPWGSGARASDPESYILNIQGIALIISS